MLRAPIEALDIQASPACATPHPSKDLPVDGDLGAIGGRWPNNDRAVIHGDCGRTLMLNRGLRP